jgi:hypothetical protein
LDRERKPKKIYVVSDGGPADFKFTLFQVGMLELTGRLDVEIEHIILAPYHGWGPCDGAKSQDASKKFHNIQLNTGKYHNDVEDVVEVFNTVRNHNAVRVDSTLVQPVQTNATLHTISSYFHFRYDPENSKSFRLQEVSTDSSRSCCHKTQQSLANLTKTLRINFPTCARFFSTLLGYRNFPIHTPHVCASIECNLHFLDQHCLYTIWSILSDFPHV